MPDPAKILLVLRIFLRLGLTSFGGPIAHIGYFRKEFVERRRWFDDRAFADLVALCQFLPGPASSQVGFAIGCKHGGLLGGLAAWCGFTLPSAAALALFAWSARRLQDPLALGGLHGLRLVAVAVVAQALYGMARSLCPDRLRAGIALAALTGLSLATGSLAQLAVIGLGACAGLAWCRPDLAAEQPGLAIELPRWSSPLALLLLLALPLLLLLPATPLLTLFGAFYRAGALVFGGGHVVLPLLRDGLVGSGLIGDGDFLAGYGAAQAVPGPLFTFAAYLGAVMLGPLGAAVALLGIFLPGLLALLAALPWWSRLRHQRRAQAAMQGVNAAIVGLLAAAFYDPLWRNSVQNSRDFTIAAGLFLLLTVWRAAPLLAVVLGGAAGMVLAGFSTLPPYADADKEGQAMKLLPRVVVVWLLVASGGFAGAAPPDPLIAATRQYLERLSAESQSPGVSAAVLVNGQIVFSGGVGVADLESDEPQTGATVHNIGSVSKIQAVVAVMQLVERGKVRLDAHIQDYAPWFPRKPYPITLRQILTHTSGIRHYGANDFGPNGLNAFRHYDSFEESTQFWRDDPLLFEPGTHWSYSSYAVDLMQAVVETASGQSYENYLAANVWGPAGMLNTQLDVPSRIVRHRGHGYIWNAKTGHMENAPNEDVSYKYAGGGVMSSDEDLVRFGHALNSGVLLRPETLAEMYRLQLPPDLPRFGDKTSPPIGAMQALIFRVGKDPAGRTYAWHSGSVKGTTSEFLNYSADDVVIALNFNYGFGPVDSSAAARHLAELYLPAKPSAPGGAPPARH